MPILGCFVLIVFAAVAITLFATTKAIEQENTQNQKTNPGVEIVLPHTVEENTSGKYCYYSQ
jgi:hypothetical protein